MAGSNKIIILPADEDALRRDGLAAVLQGIAKFENIAQCVDGESLGTKSVILSGSTDDDIIREVVRAGGGRS